MFQKLTRRRLLLHGVRGGINNSSDEHSNEPSDTLSNEPSDSLSNEPSDKPSDEPSNKPSDDPSDAPSSTQILFQGLGRAFNIQIGRDFFSPFFFFESQR